MKIYPQRRALTFGEFITSVYNIWGKRRAKSIIQMSVNAHLVMFRKPRRFVIS